MSLSHLSHQSFPGPALGPATGHVGRGAGEWNDVMTPPRSLVQSSDHKVSGKVPESPRAVPGGPGLGRKSCPLGPVRPLEGPQGALSVFLRLWEPEP